MFTIAAVATKGGVGKTTLTANLGALYAHLGLRVLLVDADPQQSLTKYFRVKHAAPHGLTKLMVEGVLTSECISEVEFLIEPAKYQANAGHLCLVAADTTDGKLHNWLVGRHDVPMRLRNPLINSPAVASQFDVVLIDTQGAASNLQVAAVNSADVLLAPTSPDMMSAREFVMGTTKLLDEYRSNLGSYGFVLPQLTPVLNKVDKTRDSRVMSDVIRDEMAGASVTMLATSVPNVVAFRNATTQQLPVHLLDQKAGLVMHQLLWEISPEFNGRYAPGFVEKPADAKTTAGK